MAANHLIRGILEPSKMVPTVAENCLQQSRHLNRVEKTFLVLEWRVMWLALVAPHLGKRAIRPAVGNENLAAFFGGELHLVNEGNFFEVQHSYGPSDRSKYTLKS